MDHFQISGRMARHAAQPAIPRAGIGNAVGVAQRIRAAVIPVLRLYPTQQQHADLRTESSAQVDGVLDRIGASF